MTTSSAPRKLRLSKQTLRSLGLSDLRNVAGGIDNYVHVIVNDKRYASYYQDSHCLC